MENSGHLLILPYLSSFPLPCHSLFVSLSFHVLVLVPLPLSSLSPLLLLNSSSNTRLQLLPFSIRNAVHPTEDLIDIGPEEDVGCYQCYEAKGVLQGLFILLKEGGDLRKRGEGDEVLGGATGEGMDVSRELGELGDLGGELRRDLGELGREVCGEGDEVGLQGN